LSSTVKKQKVFNFWIDQDKGNVMAFQIYKGNQGKKTRLSTATGLSVIVCVGCYKLYGWISDMPMNVSNQTRLLISTLVPAAVLAILSGLAFWLVNRPSVADFMITAEGELKKVNWSSKRELFVSTVVVLAVVAFMACLLGFSDLFLGWIFQNHIFKT
jgi:preprotein translocase subunit SecE